MSTADKYRVEGLVRRPAQGRDPSTLYLTVAQVAAMRVCRPACVLQAIHAGRLPAWTLAGIYLIPRRDAEDWALRPPVIDTAGREVKASARRLNRLRDAAAAAAFRDGRTERKARER